MRRLGPLLLLAVAACVPQPKAPPRAVAPPPPPAPVPPTPAQTDWRDVPLTPGGWRYAREPDGSAARYGGTGTALLTIRCVTATHEIAIERPAPSGGAMTIRTSYSSRTILPRASPGGMTTVMLPARDPLFDQMAFSRGRVSFSAPGVPTLYLPAWAEPARVIEDCR